MLRPLASAGGGGSAPLSAVARQAPSAGARDTLLQSHPTDALAADAAAVQVALCCLPSEACLQIVYDIRSKLPPVLPHRASLQPERRDGLWRQTCCELFMAGAQSRGDYLEFNFAPDGDWAAYAFDGPRQGMRPFFWPGGEARPDVAPQVQCRLSDAGSDSWPHHLQVEVRLPCPLPAGDWRISPAVILRTPAGLSHWAVQHRGERPDFHDPDGFATSLNVTWGHR